MGHVEAGRVLAFETFMTGEVFAALRDHTVLGRLMAPAHGASEADGFALGVRAAAALERPGDLMHAMFMTRTLGLFDRLAPGELAEYLSGLLIAAEIVAGARGAPSALVIGSPALAARYAKAGAWPGSRSNRRRGIARSWADRAARAPREDRRRTVNRSLLFSPI